MNQIAIDLKLIVNVTSSHSSYTGSLSYITDNNLTTGSYFGIYKQSEPAYVQLELLEVTELSSIKTFHYYGDSRTYYKTKTEVSENGVDWTVVFDSDVDGTYQESSVGHETLSSPINVKFIRDYLHASNKDGNGNHWVEISIFPKVKQIFFPINLITAKSETWGRDLTYEQLNLNPDNMFTDKLTPIQEGMSHRDFNIYPSNKQGAESHVGYISGVTKLRGSPIGGKQVKLFMLKINKIVDEVISDKHGNYKFDHLYMSEKYLVVSNFSTEKAKEQPEYAPTANVWQTPIGYKI